MISYCKNGRSAQVLACPLEKFNEIVDSPQVAQVCRLLTKTDHDSDDAKRLKQQLPLLMFMANYSDGHRHAESAVPTGMAYLDLDELQGEEPREVWQKIVHTLVMKELEQLVVLAHVSCSGKGLRIVYIIPSQFSHLSPTEQIDQSKQWLARELGVEDDSKTKDLARGSFAVPRDYIIYGPDERMWEESPPLPPPVEGENSTLENGANSGSSPKQGEGYGEASFARDGSGGVSEGLEGASFKGISYSSIIAEWLLRTGGEPQVGERNDRLHRLAAHLRYITDNNEAQLLQMMPRYGLSEDEMRGLIHSACSAKFYSMPKLMQEIVDDLSPQASKGAEDEKTPPEMPQKLPPLIHLLLSRTPDVYKPAVSHAVFPALGAHLHKTRFRYIDNVEHEATLMNVLMAGTGAGKDCISEPINHIMADIRRRDAENLAREKAWKDEVNRKGANKDKRQRPEGLVIQEVDPDMTNPAFVMRMAEADEHFLYTKMNEIDQFDALRGNGRGGQQFQIMCLAFDPGNRYGQTRVGTQSVTEKVTIRFNWNATTTIQKGQRYFERVLTDGPISRINFCTIPEREIGAEMPIYGTYDAEFDEDLRPYIERLCSARGTIDCPQAYQLVKKLKDECADFARLSQSRTYENLSFRALVIAYLKACVLYVAHDYKWDKTMEDFIRWSLQYDLWCKMRFFAEAIEQANNGSQSPSRRGPRNLLELLPNEFTMEDAVRVRREQGLSRQGASAMIRMWRNRGYIEERTNEQLNSFVFVKLKYKV
ncbi:MAG: VirE protein [Prevotella sp.]|nr:VirE protein [Prevotella sp.]